jgi:hypothetical protein
MGNIKSVNIRGTAPYNFPRTDKAAQWLGNLHTPLCSLTFKWNEEDVRNWYTCDAFRFQIHGETSMMFGALREMVAAFEAGGATIPTIHIIDIEDQSSSQPDMWVRNE